MKTLTIEIPADLYERAERRAAERGTSLQKEVVGMVERFSQQDNGDSIAAARARMQELFRTVRGFRLTPKIPREELHAKVKGWLLSIR